MSHQLFSKTLFLLSLIFFIGSSTEHREEAEIATNQAQAQIWQNLVLFAIPTVTTYNCSTLQSIIDLYTVGYQEIQGLSNAGCAKAIFDKNVAALTNMINNGQCKATNKKPSVVVPAGETMLWVLGYYTMTWFYKSPTTDHQDMGIYLKFIDRLPNADGGLVWSINPSKGVAFRSGTSGAWTSRPGISANYLRISLLERIEFGLLMQTPMFIQSAKLRLLGLKKKVLVL